jgi:hypothetical protein
MTGDVAVSMARLRGTNVKSESNASSVISRFIPFWPLLGAKARTKFNKEQVYLAVKEELMGGKSCNWLLNLW